MHESVLRLKCKNPELAAKSLEPDVKNDSDSQTALKADKDALIISIKSEKLSHLKAIINSYISIVAALGEIEELNEVEELE